MGVGVGMVYVGHEVPRTSKCCHLALFGSARRMRAAAAVAVAALLGLADAGFQCLDRSTDCPMWMHNMGGNCKGESDAAVKLGKKPLFVLPFA